jgi:hypothetical protein
VRSLTAWKSSRSRGTSAVRAIASRWRTAFVEPPRAVMATIAFLKLVGVRMSRGLRSCSRSRRITAPAASHSAALAGSSAGVDEEPGRASPRVSMATAIVFAVYMPPQAPGPGHARATMSCRSSSVMWPARASP